MGGAGVQASSVALFPDTGSSVSPQPAQPVNGVGQIDRHTSHREPCLCVDHYLSPGMGGQVFWGVWRQPGVCTGTLRLIS